MKKILLTIMVVFAGALAANAQKFALVDMEYILKHVPAYERANEQLNQVSKKWEGEIQALLNEVETLYKKYQSESVFLSDTQKSKAEEAIVAKEKEASELKKKYFGSEGELFKKRQSLMSPIQDEIYNAVKEICDKKGYQLVLDRASGGSIIYASPKIDISDEILQRLGYSN
ncbi:MAG: OmpH family outer membrane protein [Bacteroidaceae bacterium]|nr:OmpH family outer membrane protein [Bacteroidaceae bacterium]